MKEVYDLFDLSDFFFLFIDSLFSIYWFPFLNPAFLTKTGKGKAEEIQSPVKLLMFWKGTTLFYRLCYNVINI